MKRTLIAAAALALVGCGTDTNPPNSDPVDTGVAGIVVPADATNIGKNDTTYTADFPAWEFEDLSQWIGKHNGHDILDGLGLQDAGRHDKPVLHHDWCWSTDPLPDGSVEKMWYLMVSSGTGTPNVKVVGGGPDPTGCR